VLEAYEPTLVVDTVERSERSQRSVFGPATAVTPYRDLDDGTRIADGTSYGLAARVYIVDERRGRAIAREIAAGSVVINTSWPTVSAPYGGREGSGCGREPGLEGTHEFTEFKHVVIGSPGRA
jgi:betaine-aldehyde dehydrogenase